MEKMFQIITSNAFLSAIFSTIAIILLGYLARKRNIVGPEAGKVLSDVVLAFALPALAFSAFMQNINPETFTTGLTVFVFGFVAYVILIILGESLFFQFKGDQKTTLSVLTTFGSTTFFGIPIINGFLGPLGALYANIFNIAYRVFLYSYGLVRMSGVKFEKKNFKQIFLNPIVLATFVGLLIWIFQKEMPQMTVTVPLYEGSKDMQEITVGILRIDKTLSWLYKPVDYLSKLASPLAWLAIGMTLGNISLGEALKDRVVWLYSGVKLVVVPAIFVVLMLVMKSVVSLDYPAFMAIIIMLATPPATVAVAYAIKYDKEAQLASNASLLGTVLSIIAIVFWIIVGAGLQAFF